MLKKPNHPQADGAARGFLCLAAVLAFVLLPASAQAFCGFYVAKADTEMFNEASKVVLVRHEDRTVMTMANDYQGDLKEFAVVVPVPTFIEREQIHVTNNAIIDHLDAYTAPRLVEYYDDDPCRRRYREQPMASAGPEAEEGASPEDRAKSLGVTIEAEYTVGEYDILILSAEESSGLETWLIENGYKIPEGASEVLGSYIKQGTRFFVAKVNLKEQSKLGTKYLRPLQVAFETPKFMLPIRLGTVNARGPQELFVFTLTRKGRVETTNYRTVKIPSNSNIPLFVKDEFAKFYKAMFDTAVKRENMRAVFLEYAWDMSWCDPCAADPLSEEELKELGVFWLDDKSKPQPRRRIRPGGQARDVFVTRLHVRYTGEKFPSDLVFQETSDRDNYQGRYVMRHPWRGEAKCPEAEKYKKQLPRRFEKEARTLANLTGWDITEIREKMEKNGQPFDIGPSSSKPDKPWWERIWGNGDDDN
ncbi:MAG: DUF2330 domain-containing protein [Alphaproteobacteria bacterium]